MINLLDFLLEVIWFIVGIFILGFLLLLALVILTDTPTCSIVGLAVDKVVGLILFWLVVFGIIKL